ncbi:pentatricopeptide repeat-containing protein [Salvia divinorum]|uniref:Pentatricopeptide repeat-containing protein n=1 Tax=Salvia divinorum TaxID=28513 RepID=A0ABD1GHQ7_SALDI
MAGLLSFRNLLLHSHPFKPFSSSSISPRSEINAYHFVTSRALYLLQCCKTSIHLFQIQSHLITSGLFRDSSFAGRLFKLPSSLINDLCYTLLIFKRVESPDAFCVNTVMKK